MSPLLDAHGIRVVAVSSDTPAEAGLHQLRDDLPFDVMADPTGTAIRAYGVEVRHMRYFTIWSRFLPVGIPTGFRRLGIPTTILVDEAGVIRWIDPATDYRMRSDDADIRAAIEEAFRLTG